MIQSLWGDPKLSNQRTVCHHHQSDPSNPHLAIVSKLAVTNPSGTPPAGHSTHTTHTNLPLPQSIPVPTSLCRNLRQRSAPTSAASVHDSSPSSQGTSGISSYCMPDADEGEGRPPPSKLRLKDELSEAA
eukprot:1161624-Pelagomonas_calceolata.AAC.12